MNCRLHGNKPYRAAIVHGGPGAPGSAFSLAKQLSAMIGTIEPFQTKMTVTDQVEELSAQIAEYAREPVYAFGHSWGAWLSYLLAYRHPEAVRKIFLIGSGAFESRFVDEMDNRRISRFNDVEANEYRTVIDNLSNAAGEEKDALLARLGKIAGKADNYCVDDIPENRDAVTRIDAAQYEAVWREGAQLRETGFLTRIGPSIKTPIRIIHGAYDPTPVKGVLLPLKGLIEDLKCYKIEKSGHEPWKERYGKEEFWRIVRLELGDRIEC